MRYIYGLIDPRSGQYFYVGQTKDIVKRLKTHYAESSLKCEGAGLHDVHIYINKLVWSGHRPEIVVIEEVPNGLASQVEWEWALTLKLLGHPITNRLTHMVKGKADYVKNELSKLAA